jgi:hypothetical protein
MSAERLAAVATPVTKYENWLGPGGDKQNKWRGTRFVIQRPQPKNLVAEHTASPEQPKQQPKRFFPPGVSITARNVEHNVSG